MSVLTKIPTVPEATQQPQTGVYVIRHIASGKRYVGSSCRSIHKRFREHKCLLRKNIHHSPRLQNAWRKYGESEFVFEVCEIASPDHCLSVEQVMIDFYRSSEQNYGYNIASIAGNNRGIRHSEESRAKMSNAARGRECSAETRAKMSAARKGKINSPTTRAKLASRKITDAQRAAISAASRNRTPEQRATISANMSSAKLLQSTETRNKISQANRGRKHSDASRANMSAAHFGVKHSQETCRKMSETRRKMSPETRAKMSESAKRWRAELRANIISEEVQ